MIEEIFDKRKFLILIADDSKFMRFTMRKLLEEDGYKVIEAENGKDALSIFLEQKPDIVLMDYLMPDLNGVEACAKLKQLPEGNSTPVIMVTSLEDESSINLAFEAGATDYISKPINWAVLRKRIETLLYTKHTEKIIRYHAFYDYLTGLPNRLLLTERVNDKITHCRKNNDKFAMLYLDLDRFKFVNDTLGHDIGDKLLQELADKLIKYIPSNGTIARIGGDEFVVLSSEITCKEDIAQLSNKLLKVIKEPVIIDTSEIYISASIGVAIYPEHGEDSAVLMANADVAMYHAKQMGKNNFEIYTESMKERALERLTLENSLRHALEKEEFIVYYQPKVHAKTEKLIGMEALIRWKHSSLGLVPPQKFIPLAEETGLIIPIGEWVLRTACAQNKALQDCGFPPLMVSVNLSELQFQLQDLKKVVQRILKETGLEPQYLELEITESIAMQNVEHTIETINVLKEMGIKFAIDDFGTGYSSLSKLNSLSVNKLKIDKSFVNEINGEKSDSIIASTIMALGKSLKLEIVAEGVETKEQANFFKENTCDEMQGYFFGKPMPSGDFIKYCATHMSSGK